MADTLATLIVKLVADTAEITTGVKKADDILEGVVGTAKKVAGALGLAFGAREIIQSIQSVVAYGDALQSLHQKTDISVETLQALERAGKASGVTLDTITNSAIELSRRLASGDSSAAGALRVLGLDAERLVNLRMEDRFFEVAGALGHVADQGDKAALAQDLMGLSGRNMLGLLVPGLRDLIDEIKRHNTLVSTGTAKALSEAQKEYDNFKANAKATWAEIVGAIIQALKQPSAAEGIAPTVEQLEMLRKKALATHGDIRLASEESSEAQITHADLVAAKFKALRDDHYRPLDDATRSQIVQLKEYGATNKDLVEILKVTEGQLRRIADEDRMLEQMNKELGASVEKLGQTWKAMTALVKENSAEMTEQLRTDAQKQADIITQTVTGINRMLSESQIRLNALTNPAAAGSEFDQQFAAIEGDFKSKLDAATRDFQAAAFRLPEGSEGRLILEENFEMLRRSLEQERAFKITELQIGGQRQPQTSAARQVNAAPTPGSVLASYVQALKDWQRAGGTAGIPKFFGHGGIVTAPTLGVFGERGPEAVIPLDRAPGLGGITVHVHVGTFIGSDRSAAAQLAKMVGDEIMRSSNRRFSVA